MQFLFEVSILQIPSTSTTRSRPASQRVPAIIWSHLQSGHISRYWLSVRVSSREAMTNTEDRLQIQARKESHHTTTIQAGPTTPDVLGLAVARFHGSLTVRRSLRQISEVMYANGLQGIVQTMAKFRFCRTTTPLMERRTRALQAPCGRQSCKMVLSWLRERQTPTSGTM